MRVWFTRRLVLVYVHISAKVEPVSLETSPVWERAKVRGAYTSTKRKGWKEVRGWRGMMRARRKKGRKDNEYDVNFKAKRKEKQSAKLVGIDNPFPLSKTFSYLHPFPNLWTTWPSSFVQPHSTYFDAPTMAFVHHMCFCVCLCMYTE